MRVGLHTLFHPVFVYPDGSMHPTTYNSGVFQGELLRPPGLPNQACMDAWVDGAIALGRTPILGVGPHQRYKSKVKYYEFGNEPSYYTPWQPALFAAGMGHTHGGADPIELSFGTTQ